MDRRQRLLAASALAVTVLVAYQAFVALPRPGVSTPTSTASATAAQATSAPTIARDPPTPDLIPLAVGPGSSCLILPDASAACWGNNWGGVLGIGTEYHSSIPQIAHLDGTARQVAVGSYHACALLEDATLRCWGYNERGQLGTPPTDASYPEPALVPGIDRVVSVAAAESHTCAVRDDGTAWCWGLREGRIELPGITDAVGVTASGGLTCLLRRGGGVHCFGIWGGGGVHLPQVHEALIRIEGLADAIAIASGDEFACGLIADGTVRCFGANQHGQLGDGTTIDRVGAVPVLGIEGAVAIGAGPDHACAVMDTGDLYCWGYDEAGQLGGPRPGAYSQPVPQLVEGIAGVTAVDGGDGFTCAIASGEVSCWGANSDGQLGDRTQKSRSRPAPISWVPDTSIPHADTPTVRIRMNTNLHSLGLVRVRFAVSAGDGSDGSGVDHVEVRISRTGGESWEAARWQPTRWGQKLPLDVPLMVQVRAVDTVGNAGEWVTSQILARLRKGTFGAISLDGPWEAATASYYVGGVYTKTGGASATFTFTGRSFGLVSRILRTRGAFEIFVDGRSQGVIDLYWRQYENSWVVFARSWASSSRHTVRIVALGTAGRPRVDLDAFIVLK